VGRNQRFPLIQCRGKGGSRLTLVFPWVLGQKQNEKKKDGKQSGDLVGEQDGDVFVT